MINRFLLGVISGSQDASWSCLDATVFYLPEAFPNAAARVQGRWGGLDANGEWTVYDCDYTGFSFGTIREYKISLDGVATLSDSFPTPAEMNGASVTGTSYSTDVTIYRSGWLYVGGVYFDTGSTYIAFYTYSRFVHRDNLLFVGIRSTGVVAAMNPVDKYSGSGSGTSIYSESAAYGAFREIDYHPSVGVTLIFDDKIIVLDEDLNFVSNTPMVWTLDSGVTYPISTYYTDSRLYVYDEGRVLVLDHSFSILETITGFVTSGGTNSIQFSVDCDVVSILKGDEFYTYLI